MRKLLLLLCLVPLLTYSQIKISQLPAATTLGGNEIVPIVQNGITMATTVSAISQFFVPLTGATASIGGTALGAATCAVGTVGVGGSTTSMVAIASPVTYPGDAIVWKAYVSVAGTVTVKVCAIAAATPVASVYNVRVIQ